MTDESLFNHIGFGMRLNVEFGSQLLIEIDEIGQSYKGVLIGLEPQEYLIVRMQLPSEFYDQLIDGQKFVVRYKALGNEFGFISHVIGLIETPQKLVFISYPERVESIEVRKERRVGCYIPATVHLDDKKVKGIISDVSAQGCRFIIKLPEHLQPRQLQLVETVTLFFPFMGMDGVQSFSGKVCNTSIDRKRISMGLEFRKIDPSVVRKIENYIDSLTEM